MTQLQRTNTRLTVERSSYRPIVQLLNWASWFAAKLNLPVASIDRHRIIESARRRHGGDWGDERFLNGLDEVLSEVRRAPLTPLARTLCRETFVKGIVHRMQAEGYVSKHPAASEIPIKRPVFILGFPRTGTTLIQNLLALDGDRRALEFWELISPVPRNDDLAAEEARRLKVAERMLKLTYLIAPEMRDAHEVRTRSFEECWPLFVQTFHVLNWDLQSGFSGYGDWLMEQDMTHVYAEYRQQLQVLLHQRPASNLLLKCPEHLWFLDALLEVFPDACLVWTHRDPFKSVASYCSLISMNYRMLYGDLDLPRIGEHISYRFHQGVERAMAVRDRVGDDRFYDVNFERLVNEPGEVVREITNQFNLSVDSDLDKQIHAYLNNNRTDKKGAHKYSAERYGLEREAVHARFSKYIDRFDIKVAR